jgi:hypothetical protein
LDDFQTPTNEGVRDPEIASRYPSDDWPMTTDNDDDDDDDDTDTENSNPTSGHLKVKILIQPLDT